MNAILDTANANGVTTHGDNNRAVMVFDQHGGWAVCFGRLQADGFQASVRQTSRNYRADQRKAAERAIAKWLAS